MSFERRYPLIPFGPNQAVDKGWTAATGGRPAGVTWHWTGTVDLPTCTRILGGANAERRGEASAHYAIGRSFAEGVDQYVALEDRAWHAGVNQTLRWDGRGLVGDARFKGSRTTIGVYTVTIGHERPGYPAAPDWIRAADPTGKHEMMVQPWTSEQQEMMIAVGREIVARWPNIGVRDHHGHHDLCPGYKQDVAGFPFADVLRGIYGDPNIPDVWSALWLPVERQNALLQLGYDLGPLGADGDWARASDAALRKFQREHGLVQDGMWTTFVNCKVYDVMMNRGLGGFFR